MTYYSKFPDAISNHFDELFKGIGHRGSSFMDIDGLVHDGRTGRFFMMEFKWRGQALDNATEWVLAEFATLPRCTAMAVWVEGDDSYSVRFYPEKINEIISGESLRTILKDWWNNNF